MTPGAWLGVALFAGYALWLFAFFTWFRPRAMRALARRLGTRIVESTAVLDAGTWSTKDSAPLAKTGAVLGADLVLLLLGTVGMAALIFIPAFLIAESGALLPLEARLTGRAVTLRVGTPSVMTNDAGRATLPFEVDNGGRADLRSCRAAVDGYVARDGYLHGTSPSFDLAAGASRSAVIELAATRPPRGTHGVRIKLECGNERLAVQTTMLAVR